MAEFVTWSISIAAAYGAVGLLLAPLFHGRALATLDPATRGAGLLFRVLITPGLAALWPIMVVKWIRAARGRETAPMPSSPFSPRSLRRAHALATLVLAIALPTALAAALATRPESEPPNPVFDTLRTGFRLGEIAQDNQTLFEPSPTGLSHWRGFTVARRDNAFGSLPIDLAVMKPPGGECVLELICAEQLDYPALALYWAPEGSVCIANGRYLGKVWGRSKRVLSAPRDVDLERGRLVLYSVERAECIAETPFPPIANRVYLAPAEPARP